MKRFLISLLISAGCCLAAATMTTANAGQEKGKYRMSGFVINEDDSHYFYDRGPEGANELSLRKMARGYCKGQCSEVVYNLNAMRSNVDGLPFEPVWTDFEDKGDAGLFFRGKPFTRPHAKWIRCATKLHDAKIDPYRVWIEETRLLGRRACISVRMNDIHSVDDENCFLHSAFWRKHPELRRESGGLFHGWQSAALDYSRPEVRDYALRMILAVIERYDLDGIELDWMRFGHMVRPGFEDAARKALTEFHAQVRNAARKREAVLGHPVTVSVRCPALPQEAFDMGYDVVEWAQKGLIDRVVPSPYFSTSDFEIPIAFWRRILPESVRIDAGIELRIMPVLGKSGYILQSPETLCACAANYLYQGADRIYLFNHMDSDTGMPAGYEEIFSCIGTLETASAHRRRHVITFHDTVSCGTLLHSRLPLPWRGNGVSDYLRMEIGPAPQSGRKTELVIGIEEEKADILPVMNGVELRLLRTEVNSDNGAASSGVLKVFSSLRKYPEDVKTLLVFDASPAVKDGRNTVWFRNRSGNRTTVLWAEIACEALSGNKTKSEK